MKKQLVLILCLLSFGGGFFIGSNEISNSPAPKLKYKTCFTPAERCEGQILNLIKKAQNEILVQAYSFTSKPISSELIAAKKRGVKVQAIVDKSQRKARGSVAKLINDEGIPVYVDFKPAIAHNKIMIIDDEHVITGSYNFTYSAEHRNAENMLFLKDDYLARIYKKNWLSRKKLSQKF